MKIVAILVFISSFVFGMEYYSKLEPVDTFSVKAAVSGKVIYTNDKVEGKFVKGNTLIIKLDNDLNKIELAQTENKLNSLEGMLKIQQKNYERLSSISSKSAYEKDTQKVQVLNLETQKADLLIKIATLKDSIKNKELYSNNLYIYDIAVSVGDYVNAGTLLYEANDLSKGKLEIYIPISDYENILNKTIYIDGKQSDLKINKIYKVADSKHISSYKCEIIIPNPDNFSKLVKVEFK